MAKKSKKEEVMKEVSSVDKKIAKLKAVIKKLEDSKQIMAINHNKPQDQIPPIAPPQPDNITGNLNNNLKVQQLGADLFQGEALAEQEMAKRNLGKPVMPPSPDPVGDQLGNMFNQPFAQNGDFKKYETGELLDDEDFSETSGQSSIAVVKYSDIQEDKKGQYITSLGPKEFIKQPYDKNFKRPTSSTHIDQWSHKEVE